MDMSCGCCGQLVCGYEIGLAVEEQLAQEARDRLMAEGLAEFAKQESAVKRLLNTRGVKARELLRRAGRRFPYSAFPFIGEIASEKWPVSYPTGDAAESEILDGHNGGQY